MFHVTQLLMFFRAMVVQRNRLAVENLALRQQLAVLKRSVKRPKIDDSDRVFWILLRRHWKDWSDSLVFVKPDTVIGMAPHGLEVLLGQEVEGTKARPPTDLVQVDPSHSPAPWRTRPGERRSPVDRVTIAEKESRDRTRS